MSPDIAIAIRNVSKVYPVYDRPQDRLKQMFWRGRRSFHQEFWALDGINFEVRKGETVGIVGRNGSGKSTLLQIICGTLTPTTGSVERQGRLSALLELGSGFNPEFTGRENVYLNGALLGLSREEMDSRFDDIERFAEIGQFMDSPVKHYSSGMFARLAFSAAIHVDPEILIVDEILAVGDMAFQRRCLRKFYEIRDNGCSILFVSHDQYQVKSICQRAVYLEQGKQKLFGSADQVIDQYTIDTEERSARRDEATPRADGDRSPGAPSSGLPGTSSLESAADTRVGNDEQPGPPESATANPEELFRITAAELRDENETAITSVTTGQTVWLTFEFRALTEFLPPRISFVFNLYRHDDLYVCGTTTVMDGLEPFPASRTGVVKICFPDFPLLSGLYKWRVAINDDGGFITYAEAKGVCQFRVADRFKAVGMINLPRKWTFIPGQDEIDGGKNGTT